MVENKKTYKTSLHIMLASCAFCFLNFVLMTFALVISTRDVDGPTTSYILNLCVIGLVLGIPVSMFLGSVVCLKYLSQKSQKMKTALFIVLMSSAFYSLSLVLFGFVYANTPQFFILIPEVVSYIMMFIWPICLIGIPISIFLGAFTVLKLIDHKARKQKSGRHQILSEESIQLKY